MNKLFFWDGIIYPDHRPGVLLGRLLFSVASLIPRYVQYMEILLTDTHPYYYDDTMLLMWSIYVQKSAAKFTSLLSFDTHSRLGEYLKILEN